MLMETLEYLGIAFICSVILIILSKIILQALIRRPADYYDAAEMLQEEIMLNEAGISITSEHETSPEGEILEETHLEAHLSGIAVAEPEEIIKEIPESVIESIEEVPVHTEAETEPELEIEAEPDIEETSEPEPEPVIEETPEPEPETEPDIEEVPEPEPEAEPVIEEVPEPEPEAEPVIEEVPEPEPETEPEIEETPEPEPEAEPVIEEVPEPEPEPIGFSIKARTTRERRPIRKAEPEPEPEENASDEDSERHEWDETYDEIRDSLEQAYAVAQPKKAETVSAAETDSVMDDQSSGSVKHENRKSSGSGKNKKKNDRKRKPKPSMNMNKKTLTEIALSKGIEIPEGATKRMILDLIYEEKRK